MFAIDTVADARAVDFALDKSGFLHHFEMLGDCRLGQGDFAANFATDALGAGKQQAEDGHAGGMGQRLRQFSKFSVGISVTTHRNKTITRLW